MSDPISDSLKPRPDQRPSFPHTPTPWRYVHDDEGSSMGFIVKSDEYWPFTIADVAGDSGAQAENADFIIRAVNSFDSLLEACRRVRDSLQKEADNRGGWTSFNGEILLLSAAIESAEKQP